MPLKISTFCKFPLLRNFLFDKIIRGVAGKYKSNCTATEAS